ncbi:MAG: KH domain-containing protein [Cyanobacteria bacterium P01_D01_bin.105]
MATSDQTSGQDANSSQNAPQSAPQSSADYEALARFLMNPFLDQPDLLKFHSETLSGGKKLWLRAAFAEDEDKGRVFGRGGRNIKAVRSVLAAAASRSDMVVNLSVFGEPGPERSDRDRGGRGGRSGGHSRSGPRGRGGERSPRPSTNPAPPKKKPKPQQ